MISLSGSARPVDQVIREQLARSLPPPLMLRSNELLDSLKAGHVDDNVPAQLQVIFRPSVQPYLISLFRQDPAKAFAQLPMPALIVQGSNDMQVGTEDAKLLKAAKPDAELVVIEGMNHVLRIVHNDMKRQLASYKDPNLPLAAELGATSSVYCGIRTLSLKWGRCRHFPPDPPPVMKKTAISFVASAKW